MAIFNITVAAQADVYVNNPALAFYNVLLSDNTYESDPDMEYRKIPSETLLRDIIENNGALSLSNTQIDLIDDTVNKEITPASVKNPNLLSHVAFVFKDGFFENSSGGSNISSLPAGLLNTYTSSMQPININNNVGNIVSEYPISVLNQLFIQMMDANTFRGNAFRGFVDLYYNFRKSNSSFNTDHTNWSILRIQFGFNNAPTNALTQPLLFTQISFPRKTEFNTVFTNDGSYPLPYLNERDLSGNLVPIYFHHNNYPTSDNGYLEIATTTHHAGYQSNPLNFAIGDDVTGAHKLNDLADVHQIQSINDDSGYIDRRVDYIITDAHMALSMSPTRYKGYHITTVINDADYTPLT